MKESPFDSNERTWELLQASDGDDDVLARTYREAWKDRSPQKRDRILVYLSHATPQEGVDLVWQALRFKSEWLKGTGVIAALQYISRGLQPDANQKRVLQRVARTSSSYSTRSLALMALERAGPLDQQFLREVAAEDESAALRFQANTRLLKSGRGDVKNALLRDMRLHEDGAPLAACGVWYLRQALSLTDAELEEVRSLIIEHMDYLRRAGGNFETFAPTRKALSLFGWIKQGFPYTDADIDLLAASAISEFALEDRLESIDALAWFASPAAKGWLERLQGAEYSEELGARAREVASRSSVDS